MMQSKLLGSTALLGVGLIAGLGLKQSESNRSAPESFEGFESQAVRAEQPDEGLMQGLPPLMRESRSASDTGVIGGNVVERLYEQIDSDPQATLFSLTSGELSRAELEPELRLSLEARVARHYCAIPSANDSEKRTSLLSKYPTVDDFGRFTEGLGPTDREEFALMHADVVERVRRRAEVVSVTLEECMLEKWDSGGYVRLETGVGLDSVVSSKPAGALKYSYSMPVGANVYHLIFGSSEFPHLEHEYEQLKQLKRELSQGMKDHLGSIGR